MKEGENKIKREDGTVVAAVAVTTTQLKEGELASYCSHAHAHFTNSIRNEYIYFVFPTNNA